MKMKDMTLNERETLYKKTLKRSNIAEKLQTVFFSLAIVSIFVSSLIEIDLIYRGYAILYSLGIGIVLGLICTIYAKIEGNYESKLVALIEDEKSNN